jgi:hypothetical protein
MFNAAILNVAEKPITIYKAAVSNDPKDVLICLPNTKNSGWILGTAGVGGYNMPDKGLCENITTISISSTVSSKSKVCLMKVDVEGMEPFVLNSSLPLLTSNPPVKMPLISITFTFQ